jgi:hypothetical protein
MDATPSAENHMASLAHKPRMPQPDTAGPQAPAASSAGIDAIARLAALHDEAAETARLANLLGGTLSVAILLMALAGLFAATNGTTLLEAGIWCAFVALPAVAMLRAYAITIWQPFARTQLRHFARNLSSLLIFSGGAWGLGGFLALPAGTGILPALLFLAAPATVVILALREREAAFLFLMPATFVCAFAAILRPFAGGTLDAGAIVLAGAALAGLAAWRDPRRIGDFVKPAMLKLK